MATKIRSGHLYWKYPVASALVIFIGAVLTTQWAAHRVYFAPFLGQPLFDLFGYPVWSPHSYVLWLVKSIGQWDTFNALAFAIIPFFISLFLSRFVVLRMSARDLKALSDTGNHGTARWATAKDVKQMPLNAPNGVVLGAMEKIGYLVNDSSDLIGVEAPTRSGKGTTIGVPTLLYWPESVIVTDIKNEMWELTAGWRSQFTHCMRLDPNVPEESVHWNPLLEIRQRTEVRDAQNIASVLISANKDKQKNFDFFKESAQSLLVAMIIHVIYTSETKSIPYILRFMRNPDVERATTLKVMLKTKHKDGKPHPLIEEKARELIDMASSPNQLNGVWSTVLTALSVYEDPNLAAVVSSSDFKLDHLLNSERPVSLYLTTPPSDIERLDGFFRLFLNLFSQVATEKGTGARVKDGFKYREVPNWLNRIAPGIEQRLNKDMYDLSSPHKWRLLMLMDEFPAFKHMPFFEEGLAFVAGYGIKVILIYQSSNQLASIYGRDHTLIDNLSIRVQFPPDNPDIAKRISETLGKKTISVSNATTIGKRGSWKLDSISANTSEQGRELMTAAEILSMDSDNYIILVKNKPPIFAKRIEYYNEPAFNRKLQTKAPTVQEDGVLDLPDKVEEEHWNQFVQDPSKLKQILAEIKAEEEMEENERAWQAQEQAQYIRERKKAENTSESKSSKADTSNSKLSAGGGEKEEKPKKPRKARAKEKETKQQQEQEASVEKEERTIRAAEQTNEIDIDRGREIF